MHAWHDVRRPLAGIVAVALSIKAPTHWVTGGPTGVSRRLDHGGGALHPVWNHPRSPLFQYLSIFTIYRGLKGGKG